VSVYCLFIAHSCLLLALWVVKGRRSTVNRPALSWVHILLVYNGVSYHLFNTDSRWAAFFLKRLWDNVGNGGQHFKYILFKNLLFLISFSFPCAFTFEYKIVSFNFWVCFVFFPFLFFRVFLLSFVRWFTLTLTPTYYYEGRGLCWLSRVLYGGCVAVFFLSLFCFFICGLHKRGVYRIDT
jgi:hypothetical protein